MKLTENMGLRKKVRREFELHIRTRVELRLVDRYTGEERSYTSGWNTLVSGAITRFVNCITGVASDSAPSQYAGVGASLKLFNGDWTTATKTFVGGATLGSGESVTKPSPSAVVSWHWDDYSTGNYNWDRMEFWTNDPSTAPVGGIAFSRLDTTGGIVAGGKGTNDIVHAKIILEIYAASTTGFTDASLLHLGDLFRRVETTSISQANMKLRPTTAANAELGSADLAPDSLTPGTSNIVMVFTSPGAGTTAFDGEWAKTKIKNSAEGNNLRFGGCRSDGSSCGTKVAGDEWEYTYTINFVQGS